MVIVATKTFGVRRDNGEFYVIRRGDIKNIPNDVANSLIVKLAIKDGSIVVSEKSDKAIEKSIETSNAKNVERQKKAEKKSKE